MTKRARKKAKRKAAHPSFTHHPKWTGGGPYVVFLDAGTPARPDAFKAMPLDDDPALFRALYEAVDYVRSLQSRPMGGGEYAIRNGQGQLVWRSLARSGGRHDMRARGERDPNVTVSHSELGRLGYLDLSSPGTVHHLSRQTLSLERKGLVHIERIGKTSGLVTITRDGKLVLAEDLHHRRKAHEGGVDPDIYYGKRLHSYPLARSLWPGAGQSFTVRSSSGKLVGAYARMKTAVRVAKKEARRTGRTMTIRSHSHREDPGVVVYLAEPR